MRCRSFAFASSFVVAAASFAGGDSQIVVLDFEDLAESTAVSTQYASQGVVFSIEGNPAIFPIIVKEGSPTVGFTGASADAPLASGSFGLTDPLIAGNASTPSPIRITLTLPATNVRFYLADVDSAESVKATAFDGGIAVATKTITAATPGAGNGTNVLVEFAAPQITSVLLEPSEPSNIAGWGLDFLVVTRPCLELGCAPRLRVSQESAPNAGDFSSHILGEVPIMSAPTSPASAIYAYDVPEGDSWNGFIFDTVPDRSQLAVALTSEGYTIFVVHDTATGSSLDGGNAETRVEFLNDLDGGAITVKDDPSALEPGAYTGRPGGSVFTADHVWDSCCTDGYAISGLDCGGAAIVEFTDVDGSSATPIIAGLTSWAVLGADGSTIPLALEVDRRVLLQHLPPTNCPADLNCDGVVDAADLAILLGSWLGSGAADLNGSGEVLADDLAILLGEWGPC
ncbi:MAG: dockerin type I repeat-containing protein [Phycisphaerae bacterium]|nr:dockerin type I repeat-containing protein [Phycisphaerae bacterium]